MGQSENEWFFWDEMNVNHLSDTQTCYFLVNLKINDICFQSSESEMISIVLIIQSINSFL